ncbi:hypothetical protein CFN79_19090 [Chromobacterium vaccinii]|uniref:hypothetical protein n=1 Tax=Chromobacterium vaccinii TaxID=1108595 RepID=UPI000CE97E09|nr:hypothetical protein [Chromobacterium vaccinii]AVG17804.1 hypothetical protein CFN79_19090 [Chromobacterium vaccinii]
MVEIKERPIQFSADMVRALLAGAKTQTRCIVKPQPTVTEPQLRELDAWIDGFTLSQQVDGAWQHGFVDAQCPYGEPGDRLWVQETWRKVSAECGCSEAPCGCPKPGDIVYRATQDDGDLKWRPSIHMPRAASRILLEVTNVRIEQLQEIREADALAEGVNSCEDGLETDGYYYAPEELYSMLWTKIYGWGNDGWNANPWVWVIEFKRVET